MLPQHQLRAQRLPWTLVGVPSHKISQSKHLKPIGLSPVVYAHPFEDSKAAATWSASIRNAKQARRSVLARDAAWMATYTPPKAETLVMDVAGKQIKLETGEIGRQANAAVMASLGGTVLYATACCGNAPTGDGTFVPLTVNYQERFSAAGKTSGGYIKREGRPRDLEVLVSRLVDRPIRPMFNKGWATETQVLEWVMSYDGENLPETLAITAAGASLLLSDIPFDKAVAGVRVGWLPDEGFVVNPTVKQMESSKLDLLVAGTRDAILMIEGYCEFLTEEEMLKAVELGSTAIASMCQQIEAWAAKVGKPKQREGLRLPPEGLEDKIRALIGDKMCQVYRTNTTKEERSSAENAARQLVEQELCPAPSTTTGSSSGRSSEGAAAVTPAQVQIALKQVLSDIMRQVVLEEGQRLDGRGLTDIRPITSRASLLPCAHGSALFTRGETQAICVATLGSSSDALKAETMRESYDESMERFYLQYFFPNSSVGEVGRVAGPGRRELGHGELAQRALAPIIPAYDDFPYTMRVESTITESNGSSSMASVCGGCLALMDAGVPVLRPVAGIAMGLILEKDGRFCVLSDILGTEDALGDMDFKVAGDQDSITAFQMDIKVEGITLEIMRSALAQAKQGRQHILMQMDKCSPPPRRGLAEFAPRVVRMKVDPGRKAAIIGSGGRTIKSICETSGALDITLEENGDCEILAPSQAAAEMAIDFIQLLCEDPAHGRIFRQRKVTSVQAFGAFVELGPGREGLVHISEMDLSPVNEVNVQVGELIDVMVLDTIDGRIKLSRRAVLAKDSGTPLDKLPKPAAAAANVGATAGAGAGAGSSFRGGNSSNGQGGVSGGGRYSGGGRGAGRGGSTWRGPSSMPRRSSSM